MIAASHPVAANAGLQMLQNGGNAIDAAVAAAAALTVCEPASNGLGGDAFAMVCKGGEIYGLNASGYAPSAWSPAYFRNRYGEGVSAPPKRGIDSVTVPGMIAGWKALVERFGSMTWEEIFAPAITAAEHGVMVPVSAQQKWAAAADELSRIPSFSQTFLPRGRAPFVGELFQFKGAGRCLRELARTRCESFYHGQIADALVRFSREHGGALEAKDLVEYQPEWVQPISIKYRGYDVHQLPPNGQGIAALIGLGILNHFDLQSLDADDPASAHIQIEAMKLAFTDTYRYVGDRSHMPFTTEELLSEAYLASRAKLIDVKTARSVTYGTPPRSGTVFLTVADAQGTMVSLIQSNFHGFGSGCVEPTYGISLQNRGHGFSLTDGVNQVAPRKRPFHTIMPGLVTKDTIPAITLGVIGANMQPQGQVQALVRMIDHGQDPQTACDAPRWRLDETGAVNVEAGPNSALAKALAEAGHQIAVLDDSYQDYGAGQFIARVGTGSEFGYVAATDSRRDGIASGF